MNPFRYPVRTAIL